MLVYGKNTKRQSLKIKTVYNLTSDFEKMKVFIFFIRKRQDFRNVSGAISLF